MDRKKAEQQGRKGEAWAALYLRLCGWRVLARRVRTPRGEIDLIARRGKTVAFVEVKWRRDSAALDIALDEFRLSRVAAAAEATYNRYIRAGDNIRIDAVLLAPWRWPRHIVNAWQPSR